MLRAPMGTEQHKGVLRATVWACVAATLVVAISRAAIARPLHLIVIEVARVLLVLQAIVINRLAGLDYPLWRPRERPAR